MELSVIKVPWGIDVFETINIIPNADKRQALTAMFEVMDADEPK